MIFPISGRGELRAPLSVAPVTQSMADPTIDHEIGDGKKKEDGIEGGAALA